MLEKDPNSINKNEIFTEDYKLMTRANIIKNKASIIAGIAYPDNGALVNVTNCKDLHWLAGQDGNESYDLNAAVTTKRGDVPHTTLRKFITEITIVGINGADQVAHQTFSLAYDIDGNWLQGLTTVERGTIEESEDELVEPSHELISLEYLNSQFEDDNEENIEFRKNWEANIDNKVTISDLDTIDFILDMLLHPSSS